MLRLIRMQGRKINWAADICKLAQLLVLDTRFFRVRVPGCPPITICLHSGSGLRVRVRVSHGAPKLFSAKRYGSVPVLETGCGGSTPPAVTKVYSPIAQVVERNAVNVDVRSANLRRGAILSFSFNCIA